MNLLGSSRPAADESPVRLARAAGVTLLLVLATGAAGCGTDRSGGEDDVGRPSFADRLALLPASLVDDLDTITVTVADLDRAAELAGVTPPDDLDPAATSAYVQALTGAAGGEDGGRAVVSATLPGRVSQAQAQVDEFAAELGWSVLDVDWFAEAGPALSVLTVLGGTFDEDRITDAIGAPEDGRWQLGGEDGSTDLTDVTVARRLGEPLHLAMDPADAGRLFISAAGSRLDDALADDSDTLADLPGAGDLALALDDQEVYSAMLSLGDNSMATELPLPEEVLEQLYTLQEFSGVATGTGHDGEPYLVLVHAHADTATAQANAGLLRTALTEGESFHQAGRPWSELVEVEEIEVDGTTVVTRLRLRDAGPDLAYRIVSAQEPLVRHR